MALFIPLAIGAQAFSLFSGSRAAKEARNQQRIQRNQEDITAMQQRRRLFREQRVRAAQLQQSAVNTGTAGSSGEIGALGLLNANVGSQLATQTQQTATADALTRSAQTQAGYQQSASIAGAIGSTAFSLAAQSGELDSVFATLFSKKGP